MKALVQLYLASAKEFTRDRTAMFFTLLLPVAFALFFGTIFSNNQNYRLNLGLTVEDAGPAGKQLTEYLQAPAAQQILRVKIGSAGELREELSKGKVDALLLIPDGTSQAVGAGQPASLQVYYDPGRQSSASTGRGIVGTIVSQANLAMAGAKPMLIVDERTVRSKPVRAVDFYVPNMLAVAMLWLGLFATAQPLVELREQQVLRRFGATPLSKTMLLVSQVAWRLSMAVIQAALFLIVGKFVMGVEISGNWATFAAAVLLGGLVFISMGYFIAAISKTVEGAVAIGQIANFLLMFLSGTFFDTSVMPSFLQPIMAVLPSTYLNDALRQTMVSYPAQFPLELDFAILGAWLVAMVLPSLKLFKWE